MTDLLVPDNQFRHRITFTVAAMLSLCAHICLVLLPVSRPAVEESPRRGELVLLLTRSEPPRLKVAADPAPEPGEYSAPASREPVPQFQPDPDPADATVGDMEPDGDVLRRQALAMAREFPAPAHSSPSAATSYKRLPRLPSATGWLNEFVGRVQPSRVVWREPSGEIAMRVVSADGTVVCGRLEAPQTRELFNPSLSVNVMHYFTCGRERPSQADHDDPWLRPIPTRTD